MMAPNEIHVRNPFLPHSRTPATTRTKATLQASVDPKMSFRPHSQQRSDSRPYFPAWNWLWRNRMATALFIGLITPLPIQGQLTITEVLSQNQQAERDDYGDYSDWLELHNPSTQTLSLADWALSDDPHQPLKWLLPDFELPPQAYLRLWCSGRDRSWDRHNLHTNFKLSRSGERLLLTPRAEAPEARSASFDYRGQPQFPDISFGLSNQALLPPVLPPDSLARYHLSSARQDPKDWHEPNFVEADAVWLSARGPFGFDRRRVPDHADEIRTDLSMVTPENAKAGYFRFHFRAEAETRSLPHDLTVRYKDGFTAYLNGHLIGRKGVLKGAQWDPHKKRFTPDIAPHPIHVETISGIQQFLHPGDNVLAIKVLFGEGTSVEMHLGTTLRQTQTIPSALMSFSQEHVYFPQPTPGKPNGPGMSGVAPAPKPNHPSGIYPTPFELRFSMDTDATAHIHYTTDGTTPTQASLRYGNPILIDRPTRIQVRSFQSGALPSETLRLDYSVADPSLENFRSDLPVVLVDAIHQPIVPRSYTDARIRILAPDASGMTEVFGKPNFSGRAGIKVRGSSTRHRPKKSYRLELWDHEQRDQAAELLDMPADADWILYGPYNFDTAMIRSVLVYRLSQQMGHYAARTRFVEVFVNTDDSPISMTDYRGLYVLMETIKQSPDRVNLASSTETAEPRKKKPGFIFKVDRLGPGEQGFRAGYQSLVFVDPSESAITPKQRHRLESGINAFFSALTSPDFRDPKLGYASYINVEEWIDQRWIQEITRNPDAYSLSTHYCLTADGKLRSGPAWDFDHSMRTNTDYEWIGYKSRPKGWVDSDGYNWDKLLMDDPAFNVQFLERGRVLLNGVWSIENVHQTIDTLADEIAQAQTRNHQRWGYLNPRQWRAETEFLKAWYVERHRWLLAQCVPPPLFATQFEPQRVPNQVTLSTSLTDAPIYFTTDNSDPVNIRDRLTRTAQRYTGPIRIEKPTTITATIQLEHQWSEFTTLSIGGTSAPLAITEIMYQPSGGHELEFIEIQNVSDAPLNLEGFSLTGEVDFEFADGTVTELAPKAFLVITQNLETFSHHYDTSSMNVTGNFDWDLSDTNGRIIISGPIEESIAEAFYTESWLPEASGGDYSITLAPKFQRSPERWRDPHSWRLSSRQGGSPGRAD